MPRREARAACTRAFGSLRRGVRISSERGARVALSAADWDLIENPPPAPPPPAAPSATPSPAAHASPSPAPGSASLPPPKRDLVVIDGQPLGLGGVEITPVSIPGHTPGSLGFVFKVQDGGRAHTAALFGGSILLSSRIPDAGLEQYVRSVEHFADVTRRLGVDVEIQNHPLYDGFEAEARRARLAQIRRAPPVRGRHGRLSELPDGHERLRARRDRAAQGRRALTVTASAWAAPRACRCPRDRGSAD